jgi:hypothetical protein
MILLIPGEGLFNKFMPEIFKQESTEPVPEQEREIIHCYECEDVGACARCERGRQWMLDHPFKDLGNVKSKKIRKKAA